MRGISSSPCDYFEGPPSGILIGTPVQGFNALSYYPPLSWSSDVDVNMKVSQVNYCRFFCCFVRSNR